MYNKGIVLLLYETNDILLSFSRYSSDVKVTMTSLRRPILFLMHRLENQDTPHTSPPIVVGGCSCILPERVERCICAFQCILPLLGKILEKFKHVGKFTH